MKARVFSKKISKFCKLLSRIFQIIKSWFTTEEPPETTATYDHYTLSPEQTYKSAILTDSEIDQKDPGTTTDSKPKPEKHLYYISDNKLIVSLNDMAIEICNSHVYAAKDDKRLEILIHEGEACLSFSINVFQMKLKVAPAHATRAMDEQDASKLEHLNPMVVCSKRKTKNPIVFRCKHKDKIHIYTLSSDMTTRYLILTTVFQKLDAMIMVKGKPKLVTIGIIIHLAIEQEFIFSGSLVLDKSGGVYVVSSVTNHKDGFKIIVAWAVIEHSLTGVILNEE
jgi:hypothetical protein